MPARSDLPKAGSGGEKNLPDLRRAVADFGTAKAEGIPCSLGQVSSLLPWVWKTSHFSRFFEGVLFVIINEYKMANKTATRSLGEKRFAFSGFWLVKIV